MRGPERRTGGPPATADSASRAPSSSSASRACRAASRCAATSARRVLLGLQPLVLVSILQIGLGQLVDLVAEQVHLPRPAAAVATRRADRRVDVPQRLARR